MSKTYQVAVNDDSLKENLCENDQNLDQNQVTDKQSHDHHTAMHFATYFAALGAAFAYGAHAYAIAYAARIRPSISCIYPQWIVYLSTFFIYHSILGMKAKANTGKFWNKENSSFYKRDINHFDYINLLFINLRVLGSVGSFSNVYFLSRMAILADMSPALAQTFSTIAIFIVAVIFYYMFKHKVTLKLFAGMLMVIAAIVLTGVASQIRSDSGQLTIQTISAFWPILFGLLQGVLNAYNALILKVLGDRGYSSLSIAIDYLFIYSFFPLGFYIYEVNYGEPYTFENIMIISVGSFVLIIAHFLSIFAYVNGNGGRTQAICQLYVMFQMILEIIIDGRIPLGYEVGGLVLGSLGAIIMANK